ncbi:MAG: homoserine O-succinyltransferase [Lachnospiraceae bacterium]|nr:homoserine O-succinyltransferase [Lachnospiraceae bacterium]
MPIRIKNDLQLKQILESENVFIMDETRAEHQDIRPVDIAVLNLDPDREDAEISLLRALSNTLLQVNVTLLLPEGVMVGGLPENRLNTEYKRLFGVSKKCFDGLVITGEADAGTGINDFLDWSFSHVTSTLCLGSAAARALEHFYGIAARPLLKGLCGVYGHVLSRRGLPLVRGFDDTFLSPHLRDVGIDEEALKKREDLIVLAQTVQKETYLCMNRDGSRIFCLGHPEYDRLTLDRKYRSSLQSGGSAAFPGDYYADDDEHREPVLKWRGHSNALFSNWLNYYVYQNTPFELNRIVF